jgi:hypothetical protein
VTEAVRSLDIFLVSHTDEIIMALLGICLLAGAVFLGYVLRRIP